LRRKVVELSEYSERDGHHVASKNSAMIRVPGIH
jgi:hypothetical protein